MACPPVYFQEEEGFASGRSVGAMAGELGTLRRDGRVTAACAMGAIEIHEKPRLVVGFLVNWWRTLSCMGKSVQ
jgi:hypothetical protein